MYKLDELMKMLNCDKNWESMKTQESSGPNENHNRSFIGKKIFTVGNAYFLQKDFKKFKNHHDLGNFGPFIAYFMSIFKINFF